MRVVVHGSTGRMGQNLLQVVARNHTLAAAVSVDQSTDEANLQYHSLPEFTGEADMIIDFSHHTAVFDLLDYAEERNLPVVIGTTGQTEEELARVKQAAEKIPVFRSGNMSLGIALLMNLARQTAKTFPDAEVEIVEIHHDRKLDVPSGTALMLAQAVKEGHPNATFCVGRHENGLRDPDEIGIHSLRMGNVVGIHEVHVTTGTQTITLRHEAHDRMLFAEGALAAAEYLLGKPAGLYDMHTMLK